MHEKQASQWTKFRNRGFDGLGIIRVQMVPLQGNGVFGLLVILDDLRVATVRLAALLADAMRMVRDDRAHHVTSHFVTQVGTAEQ